ncbi:MAG: NAD-dependent epimerase/dehydratase family protein [Gaiellaceae bacterium]
MILSPEVTDAFRGRRVLVTGGLGFIGSNLAWLLREAGAELTLVDSLVPTHGGNHANLAGLEGVQVELFDVRDTERLAPLVRRAELLFSLAGQTSHIDSMREPLLDLEHNCGAQLAVLESCRRENPGIRVVFAGTRQVYGRPRELPVSESHPLDPVDVNGIHKLAGEWYHLLYARVYGLSVSVLRLTNTYGPRMRVRDSRQTFLGTWIRQVLTGEELRVFGDGTQQRDFTFVDDAVEALCLAAVRDEAVGEIFNVGGDDHLSLLELAELLVRSAGTGSYRVVPFPQERRAIDIGDYLADDSKLRGRLGWQPRVDLEEGLVRTLDYYRVHGGAYWGP